MISWSKNERNSVKSKFEDLYIEFEGRKTQYFKVLFLNSIVLKSFYDEKTI